MAYDLNMQINLQLSPGNVAAIKKSIESSLSNLKIGGVDAKSFSKVNAQISETTKRLNTGQKAAKDFAETLEFKARSFAAYTIASTAILKLTGAISQATREAIKFEKELINISQTTGDSIQATKEQAKVLINISKQYNVSISKVAQLTRTIAQAGFSFRDAAKGAEILARTSLLAGFDSLSSTTEGLIAVMQTFNLTMDESGKVLEKINIVSKKFAVESGDIVEAIKRTGGAFSSAGGTIEELIALFTSVRATTRESAETIATGFRTIFARLQRPKTIEYFKELGIVLEDSQGQFIGPLKAIELIGRRLEELGIRAGTVKFAEVVEQIGGIRQISKVIPLLEQYGDTQKALAIQNQAGADSLDDVKKAQQGLGFQLGALQQQFVELVQDVVNSKSFKVLAETFITVSRAVLTLTKSLEPLLPLLTAILTVKIGRGITKFLSGGFSLKGMKEAAGFASGGLVPGSGNRDTVPAMLTPGEFVIRKSAVNAVGAGNLAKINRYKLGGTVERTGQFLMDEYTSLKGDQYKVDPNKKYSVTVKKNGLTADSELLKLLQTTKNKNPKDPNWKIFEQVVGKYAGENPAGGNSFLDYPNRFAEAKFLLEDQIYGNEGKTFFRGNNNQTMLAKALGQKTGIKTNLGNVTVYYPKSQNDLTQMEKVLNPKTSTTELAKIFGLGYAKGGEVKAKQFGKIGLSSSGSSIKAEYIDGPGGGQVVANNIGNNLFSVSSSTAQRGYGPRLYDIVMEEATKLGAMLVSDRSRVSAAAYKVWKYYFENRNDVKKSPLSPESWNLSSYFDSEKFANEDPKTWPPYDDLAWVLQMGYSKAPKLINSGDVEYKKFATGGAVGTDTVPALLTPGEFVVNKKSAQAFGYGNLKQINKYAKGGTVGKGGDSGPGQSFFGSIISSITGMFKSTKIDTSSIEKDLQRGTGEVIQSMDQFKQELFNVIKDLGQAGVEVAQTFKYAKDVGKSKDGKPRRGSFDPNAKQIRVTMGKGTQSTVAHEAGHAVDYRAGGMKGYASEQQGTLQNTLAKMAQDQIKQALIAKGVTGKDLEYRTDLRELFADLFEKSDPAVRKILANTISAEKGMHQLSQLMITEPEKYKRLYGDIQNSIMKTAQYEQARAVQAALGAKEAEKAAKTVSTGPTKKSLRKEALAGGRGAIEKQIAATTDPAQKKTLIAQARAMKTQETAGLKGGATGGFAEFDKRATEAAKQMEQTTQAASGFKTSILEMVFYASSAGSMLKNFAGIEINQKAIDTANVKSLRFGGGAEILGKVNTENVNKLVNGLGTAGKYVEQFGAKLGPKFAPIAQKIGGGLGSLSTKLAASAPKIIASAGMLAKGLNVAAIVEAVGGLVDGIFSIDYEDLKQQAIARGDVEAAGANAVAAYNQEFLRGIPLVGGLLSAMQELIPSFGMELSARAQLIKGTAELQAATVRLDKDLERTGKNLDTAFQRGNTQEIQSAMDAQDKVLSDFKNRADEQTNLIAKTGSSSAGDVMSGAATGAVTGAGIGGLIGSVVPVVGTAIGAAVGGTIGAITGGIAGYSSSLAGTHEDIMKAYETQSAAYEKWGKENAERISQIGSAMTSTAVKVMAAGGTTEDAFNEVQKVYGEKRMKEIFGDIKDFTPESLEQAYQNQKKSVEEYRQELDNLDKQIGDASANVSKGWEPAWYNLYMGSKNGRKEAKAGLETQKAQTEAELKAAEARQQETLKMQQQINAQAALNKEREIEAAAIRKQVEVSRAMNKAFDNINKGFRNLTNMEDEISKIGTGQLTKQQAMDATGMTAAGISRDTLEMSSEEILRNPAAMQEMTNSIGRMSQAQGVGPAITNMMQETQKNLAVADELESSLIGGGLDKRIAEIKKTKTAGDATGEKTQETMATSIAGEAEKSLRAKGVIQGEVEPRLKAALQEFGKDMAEGVDSKQAIENLKQKIGKDAAEAIEKQQKALNELVEKQQKLREYEIELVNKRMELAQKAYDVEKDYFDKRNNLNNKIRDVLQPIPTGPGAAGAIQNRAAADRATARAGLANRRGSAFQEAGLGGGDLQGAIRTLGAGVQNVKNATGDVGTAFQQLAGQSNLLLSTIQDEIAVEEQYLDSLIDSAKAQQEYTQSLYDAQGEIVRNLVTGTDEEVGKQLQVMNAAAMAAQQGSFAGVPEDMKKDVFALYDQFGDVEIPGLGMTGRDAQREITKNEMMRRFGVDEATATQLASKAVKDRVPVDERMAEQIKNQEQVLNNLYAAEHQVKMYQIELERHNTATFAASVEAFRQSVNAQAKALGLDVPEVPAAAMPAQPAQFGNLPGQMFGGPAQMLNPDIAKAQEALQNMGLDDQTVEQLVNKAFGATKSAGTMLGNAGQMFGGMFGGTANPAAVAQQGVQAAAAALQGAQAEIPTYGLNEDQRAVAQQLTGVQDRISQFAGMTSLSKPQQQEYENAKQRKAMYERQLFGYTDPETGEKVKGQFGDTSRADLGLYQDAYRQQQSNIPAPVAANNPAQAQQITPATTGQQTGNQPIQVQTQGQQEITVRLPDIQALVNQSITAMVFQQVGTTFNTIAEGVRTANNFEDAANVIAQAASQTTTQNMGGQ